MQSLTLKRTNLSIWITCIGVALFAVATAVSARVRVPVAFSPVPLTLQVLVVIMSGFVLGPRAAFAAQMLYLQALLMGMTMNAAGLTGPAALMGPTAGYLWAFPVAAAAASWFAHRSSTHRPLWRGMGGLLALALIYGVGMVWLNGFVGGMANAWKLGVLPFVGADLLKVVIAVFVPLGRKTQA